VTTRHANVGRAQHLFSYLLKLLNIKNAERFSTNHADAEVKAHYRSYPLEMAEIWYDLCHFDQLPAALRFKRRLKSMKGFIQYAMAMYWLWAYPKNATRFLLVIFVQVNNIPEAIRFTSDPEN
jgi:hypothetical protein